MNAALPMILEYVEAVSVERLSPSFVRVELSGPSMADFGVDGALLDQRIKLVFPADSGRLPAVEGADETWWETWAGLPDEERGHMRTYTVREVRGSGPDARLVVDLVLHLAPGAAGPGSRWAAGVTRGDRIVLVGPRRGVDFGGIEFDPGEATRLLLAGDETAVPAICAVLRDLSPDAEGAAFLEVPVAGDVLEVDAPVGVEVCWLPRAGAAHGSLLTAAVVAHLGAPDAPAEVADHEVDPDLWETPTYSSSGERLPENASGPDGLYAWIAGESGVVTGLRRYLVRELGVDRRQVAFMGYWRRGVAMRS